MLKWILWPVLTVIALAVIVAAVLFGLAQHSAIAAITPPSRSSFSPAVIQRGRELAAIGHCAVCHTQTDGRAYAGGRAIDTPLGVIYSANITPDATTGIGRWSFAAFARALRSGVSRSGRQLYPAFPYDHFTHLEQRDVAALYAYLMTRTPVRATPPANRLAFPFNFRAVVAGWNLLFLHPGPVRPRSGESAEWNRGAYLVTALADCGGCHTPRDWLQAEQGGQHFAGGDGEGWYAPALDRHSPAPVPWTVEQLQTYLSTGFEPHHGAAAGPMRQVTRALADVPPADVHAMAVYVGSLLAKATPPKAAPAPAPRGGASASEDLTAAQLYGGACAVCHEGRAAGELGSGPPLISSTVLTEPSPRDFVQILLHGISDRETFRAPFMPAFAATFTDAQVTALANYLRQRFAGLPPWHGVLSTVRQVRAQGAQMDP